MEVLSQLHLLVTLCMSVCGPWGVLSMPDPKYRDALIQMEASMQTGGQVVLTEDEKRLNSRLLQMKEKEVMRADFPPAMHFFKARDLIKESPLFPLLQKVPKGAALHVHDLAMVDVEWLVKNVTYRPYLYMCFTDGQSVRFIFSSEWPKQLPYCSPWELLEKLRATVVNTTELDDSIRRNLTIFTDLDPDVLYPTQDVIWGQFEQAFLAVSGLVSYAPVFRDYYHQGLSEFYTDNVMYLEVRALLPEVYELDGSTRDRTWALKTYQEVTKQFIAEHPDFFGARVIFTIHRGVNSTVMGQAVEEAMELKRNFPDFMAGFDLVGREDQGRPLWYFRNELSLPSDRGQTLPFFFHAGETSMSLQSAVVDSS